MVFPSIIPLRLTRLREPFDRPDWIYEIKHDGFRGLAYISDSAARLVSRNGNVFRGFETLCAALGEAVEGDAILDGEIVCLGPDGRTLFNPLLYRRAEPYFYAFDCLWRNGRDLRRLALLERKEILRSIVPAQPCRLLYVDHVAGRGTELFRGACGMDLEGIVAKWAAAPYGVEGLWVKIKNATYSQAAGRREQFEAMRSRRAELTR